MEKYVIICGNKLVMNTRGGIYHDYDRALAAARTLVSVDKVVISIAKVIANVRPSDEVIVETV